MEQYENSRAIQRILQNKTQSFHTKSHLENNKEIRTFQHKQKKMLCVNEKLEITSYLRFNLLRKRLELINECRHQNRFTLTA